MDIVALSNLRQAGPTIELPSAAPLWRKYSSCCSLNRRDDGLISNNITPNLEEFNGTKPILSHESCGLSFPKTLHTQPITQISSMRLLPRSSLLRSNLDVLVIFDNDLHPLITALTVLTGNSLFLVVAIAEVATDKVSRSIMRSVPRRELRVGDLPQLERLGTAFESDEFLSQGVVPPLW